MWADVALLADSSYVYFGVVFVAGMGYSLLEHWGLADAIYFLITSSTTIGFGDFVEACYPHMERSARVNIAAYAGAALAGAVLLAAGDAPGPPRSSAYLPMPLAAAVSDQPGSFALAAMLAFTVPFALSLGA